MILNYLKTSIRSMFRRDKRLVPILNLLGLALSLAACTAIFLHVKRELSFDTTHPKSDRMYRLVENLEGEGHTELSSSCPYPSLPALFEDNSHLIESYVRIFDFQTPIKSIKLENGEFFNENRVYYADSTLFQVWDIPLVLGNKEGALDRMLTIVLSQDLANKYFPGENPIGKSIFLLGNDKLKCEVTGVMGKGGPSHFQPNAVISIASMKVLAPHISKNWVWNPVWSYLVLKEGISPAQLEAQLPEFVAKYHPDFSRDYTSYGLQPVSDIHLKSHREFEMTQNSDMKYIYIFISCGIFLLIIAAINFVNLTSLQLIARNREMGMRRILGATRGQITFQIILESLMFTFMAFLLAVLFLVLLQPILGTQFNFATILRDTLGPGTIAAILMGIIFLGTLSGLYPAMVYSRAGSLSIVGHGRKSREKVKWFRKTLVVVQFGIAVILIVFTIISLKQLRFMQEQDKGFVANNILVLDIYSTPLPHQLKAFKQELKQHSGIVNVSIMNELLGINNNNHEYNHEGMPAGEWKYFPTLCVDEEFLETFQIPLTTGRDFDVEREREDSLSLIINESMAKWIGYQEPHEAIGKRLHSMTGKEKIVGVTPDFHFKSFHHPVGPFVLDISERRYGQYLYFAKHIAVRVSDLEPETLEHIETTWNKFVKNKRFDYRLLGQEINRLYEREQNMASLLAFFTALAIIIACMGLFALTWHIAKTKTREIAIRKTLGADDLHLIRLATKEEMMLVLLALAIGFPVSYLLTGHWLQSFAYRVGQGLAPYAIAGFAALAIAFATIVFIALRTIRQNPVEVLKYE